LRPGGEAGEPKRTERTGRKTRGHQGRWEKEKREGRSASAFKIGEKNFQGKERVSVSYRTIKAPLNPEKRTTLWTFWRLGVGKGACLRKKNRKEEDVKRGGAEKKGESQKNL